VGRIDFQLFELFLRQNFCGEILHVILMIWEGTAEEGKNRSVFNSELLDGATK
jgi:hypothetical protein